MKTLITFFDRSTEASSGRRQRIALALEFKLEDLWLGLFWKRGASTGAIQLDLWLCLIPCLPLHFKLIRVPPPARDLDAAPPVFVEPGRKPSARQRRSLAGMRQCLEDELACAPCRRRLLP